jgi:AraC-like DNA-binding protein
MLPRYSTHEIVTLLPRPGGVKVQAGWSLVLDDETMNLTQQFTAALIVGLCLATRRPDAVPRTISIRPDPVFGLDHLRPIFGGSLVGSDDLILTIDIDDGVLDAPLLFSVSPSCEQPSAEWVMPKGEFSFGSSVYLALQALRPDMPVTIHQVAALAGMSVRSFQRALAHEGSSFRSILDDLRRAQVLDTLSADPRAGRLVAADLGFSGQSSMSRAVRRWTGVSPRKVKRVGAPVVES